MAWGTIRKATEDDVYALEKAARRFIARHDIRFLSDTPETYVKEYREIGVPASFTSYLEGAIDQHAEDYPGQFSYLRMLWKRCMRRALGESDADGIEWGYVGYNAD